MPMLCSIHNKQYTEERERLILYSQLLDADELLNAISSPAKSCDILNTTTNNMCDKSMTYDTADWHNPHSMWNMVHVTAAAGLLL